MALVPLGTKNRQNVQQKVNLSPVGPEKQLQVDSFPQQEPTNVLDRVASFLKPGIEKGTEQVEKLRATRPSQLETIKSEAPKIVDPNIKLPRRLGALGLTAAAGIGLPFERAESVEAGIVEPLQGIKQLETPFIRPGKDREAFGKAQLARTTEGIEEAKRVFGEIGRNIKEGITGEKVIEFGDIYRNAGIEENTSKALGLYTAIIGADPLVGKAFSKFINNLTDVSTIAKRKILTPQKGETIIPKLESVIDDVDNMANTLGKPIGDFFSKSKDFIDQKVVNSVVNKLPTKVKKILFSEDTANILGLKVVKGVVENSAENVWKLRRFLDDVTSNKEFVEGTSSLFKQPVAGGANTLRRELNGLGDDIASLMDKFSNFIKKSSKFKSIIRDSKGSIKEKPLRGLFQRKGEELGRNKVVREVAEIVPSVLDVLVDSARIASGVARKKAVTGVAKTAAKIGLLRTAFRGLKQGGGTGGDNTSAPK